MTYCEVYKGPEGNANKSKGVVLRDEEGLVCEISEGKR